MDYKERFREKLREEWVSAEEYRRGDYDSAMLAFIGEVLAEERKKTANYRTVYQDGYRDCRTALIEKIEGITTSQVILKDDLLTFLQAHTKEGCCEKCYEKGFHEGEEYCNHADCPCHLQADKGTV